MYEGEEAYTVDHNWDEELQEVTEYDIRFRDGTVKRNVPINELEVLEAFSEANHGNRDSGHPDVKDAKKKKKKKMEEVHCSGEGNKDDEEEVNEEKMPDENNDGVPDFAQDGKGKNDLGKGKTEPKKKAKKGEQPPQLAAYQAKKKGKKEKQEESFRDSVRKLMEEIIGLQ